MIITLIVLGSLAALIGLAVLVGSLLPVKHTATAERNLSVPRSLVWNVITDFGSASKWVKGVARVERVGTEGGAEIWREFDSKGDGISYKTESIDRPFCVTRRIADKGLPYGGSWTISVESAGAGTVVKVREDGEVYNPFFRFVSKFIIGHKRTVMNYLNSLEAHMVMGQGGHAS